MEADVKDNYGAIPDYASLIPPEVVPQVTMKPSDCHRQLLRNILLF